VKASVASLFGVLLLFGYAVYGKRPLVAEPWQWADDGLYWQQAVAIQAWLSGSHDQWLGDYSTIVLSKAPFFAIFLVVTNATGIPLPVLQFGLLSALAFYSVQAFRPIYYPGLLGYSVIFIVFLCFPMLPSELRLTRNVFSALLSGFLMSSLAGFILRGVLEPKRALFWAAASGLFLSFNYLCREEAVWLFAPTALAFCGILMQALAAKRLLKSLVLLAPLLSALMLPVLLVSTLNYLSYGAFLTTERRATEFNRAYRLLASLEPDNRRRFAPLPRATRRTVYQVSPSFAQLEPFLEGQRTDSLATNPGHLKLNGAEPGEREFFVSNFEFALRRAAWDAGAQTAQAQEEFWLRVTVDVRYALEQELLDRGSKPIGAFAPLSDGDGLRIVNASLVSLLKLLQLEGCHIPTDPRSSGNPDEVDSMGALTNSQLAPAVGARFSLPNNTPLRATCFRWANMVVRSVYIASVLTLVGLFVVQLLQVIRNNPKELDIAKTTLALVFLSTLCLFCAMMGLLDTCGWPHLSFGFSYNRLGLMFLPLITICAWAMLCSHVFGRGLCVPKADQKNR